MKDKNQITCYTGVDITKLICAFFIVFLHTFCYDFSVGFWIKDVLSLIGVPFFFIASGFFLNKGLNRNEGTEKQYISKYLSRLVYMYVFWSVITLPISWYDVTSIHADYSALMVIVYHIRQFFLSGSMGIYWFVLSLIYCSAIIYYFHKRGFVKYIFLLSIPLLIIGVMWRGGGLKGTTLSTIIHTIFSSERNFLNVGLFYTTLGYLFSQYKVSLNRWLGVVLFAISILSASIVRLYTHYQFMQIFEAIFLFLLVKEINPSNDFINKCSFDCRKLSTALYLIHFPFIIAFDLYLKNGTYIDFPLAVIVSVAIYTIAKKILPKKTLSTLFG